MSTNTKPLQYLNQIAAFLKVQSGKTSLNEEKFPIRAVSKKSSIGYINIIFQLLNEANSNLDGCSPLEKAEVRQWIEYIIVYALQADSSTNINYLLKELNAVLATRTYFVFHKLTIADVFLYYVLQSVMENLTCLEKEKFINISRWFDNMQQDPAIRQSNKIIDFSTNYLVNLAPARH